jgi:hypothetical protein
MFHWKQSWTNKTKLFQLIEVMQQLQNPEQKRPIGRTTRDLVDLDYTLCFWKANNSQSGNWVSIRLILDKALPFGIWNLSRTSILEVEIQKRVEKSKATIPRRFHLLPGYWLQVPLSITFQLTSSDPTCDFALVGR